MSKVIYILSVCEWSSNTRLLDFNLNEPPIILQVSQATRDKLSCLVQNANPKDTVWRDDKDQLISSGESLIIQQVSLLAYCHTGWM